MPPPSQGAIAPTNSKKHSEAELRWIRLQLLDGKEIEREEMIRIVEQLENVRGR